MTASGPLLAEPLAAVLGGIVALSASAIALVAWRDELRQGPVMRPAVWAGAGAAGGALLYAAGLVVLGRGAELAQPAALLGGVPWALALVMLVGAGVAWVSGARAGWHPAGVCVLAALVLACTGWAAFLVTARVGAFLARPTPFGGALVLLLAAQLLALLLVCAVATYMLDGLVRREWLRTASRARHDPAFQPKVAIHVACYDEPPEVVARTLDSLVAQDYPREKLHVVLVDDSTSAADVEALREACEARGIEFLHRERREGFKAGALNGALRATPPDVELIAVVDADFVADPGFLRDNVGYFADPKLSFVQTKLDYSNPDESFTARYATLMEHFFYASMMRTRNEGNAILFCGTMGIVRKQALLEVGGWTDGHVGEDVDLSCRMLMDGWTSLYVPKVYGKGLQTPTQEAFRRQQARWAYGGARILRDHGRRIVLGRMTPSQKAHYLYGPVFWLDGSLALLFATSMTFFAAAFLSGALDSLPVHDLVFVGLIPILVILENMLRSAFTMRRLLGIGLREVAGLVALGWSGKLMNATAAWAALLGVPRPFHRTPKRSSAGLSRRAAALQALRVAPVESFVCLLQAGLMLAMGAKLALSGSGGAPFGLMVAAVLMTVVWTAYFGSAPLCVYLGHVTQRTRLAGQARGSAAKAKRAAA